MAKNFNSVSFTVLLVVLVMASTGILKSEAIDCEIGGGTCSLSTQRVFSHECGPEPFLGTDGDCCTCCKNIPDPPPPAAPLPPFCWAIVEGTDRHCHCYKKKV